MRRCSDFSILPTLVSRGSTQLAARGPEHLHDANLIELASGTQRSQSKVESGYGDQDEGSVEWPQCVTWEWG